MGQSSSTPSSDPVYSVPEARLEPLTLLLMGKTGNGKSSLGNSILGCKFFNVGSSVNSQTREVDCGFAEFRDYLLKVVDGPGLEDTELDKVADTERAIQCMGKALLKCCEGVDAFLFVFRLGNRYTKEEMSVLETLKGIFGQDYFKHVIVVLTYGDQFEDLQVEEKSVGSFDDWCQKQTGPFKDLYESCQRRCLLFNNKENREEKQTVQREELVNLASSLRSRHGRYTADCFSRATAGREKMMIKLKQPILKEEIQKQAALIYSKIQKYCKSQCPESKTEIEEAIDILKNEIEKEDKNHGLLKDLMKIVLDLEKNLQFVDKVHDLAEKLEAIRKATNVWSKLGSTCGALCRLIAYALSTKRLQ